MTLPVFVDELEVRGRWKYGPSSHLLPWDLSATALESLHALAQQAGLKRSWFQEGRWPHYDCAATLRAKTVSAGAIELKSRAWMHLQRFLKKGSFIDEPTGLQMNIGSWYIISDSGSAYSPTGYQSAPEARTAALALPDYNLTEEEVTIQPFNKLGTPLPDPNAANIVKADALLVFYLMEDYWEFIKSQPGAVK